APGRPRPCARSPIGADAGRCRHTVVAVPPGSPSVVAGLVGRPRVCSSHSVPGGWRRPGGSTSKWPFASLPEQRRRPAFPGLSRGSGAALLHDISDVSTDGAPERSIALYPRTPAAERFRPRLSDERILSFCETW